MELGKLSCTDFGLPVLQRAQILNWGTANDVLRSLGIRVQPGLYLEFIEGSLADEALAAA